MYLPFSPVAEILVALEKAAADRDVLWLLCVADAHGDQVPDLLAACQRRGLRVCGGVFPGLIHGGERKHQGLLAIPLPAASQLRVARLESDAVSWLAPPPTVVSGQTASAMILVDCAAPNISGLLEDVYDRFGNGLSHVGAGAGYGDLRKAPALFTEQGFVAQSALLLIVPQRATVSVRHGWKRIAGPFVASRTCRNVIQELNWEPAGTYYRDLVVAHNPDYAQRPVFPDLVANYPLSISKEGGEDVIRDPFGVNEADELIVLSDVTENAVMYLAHGNKASLIAAARQAVADCGQPGEVARCFVSDCYSRSLMLGDAFNEELQAAQDGLKAFCNVTQEGVLAMGEIAANGRQNLEFFNKTFVVALSHP